MNISKTLNIILFAALAGLIIALAAERKKDVSPTDQGQMESQSIFDVIHKRTSIRAYEDRAVQREILEKIVQAGAAAPSAMNKQPWRFIVVDDKEVLTALGGDLQTSRMVQTAPAAIIVCGDLEKAGKGWLQEYWIQDCSAVSENILLAATGLGLGSVWTSVYPARERMDKVTAILALPEHIIPFNIIPLGYPGENPEPKQKWSDDLLHWNNYGGE